MLTLEHVTYSYDQQTVLEDISLSLHRGRIYALVGRSGIGKTTLLRLLGGVYRPDSGVIRLQDEALDPRTANIAYVPQHYGLIPWYSVKKNILLPRKLKEGKSRVHKKSLKGLCQELRIEDVMNKYPAHISGGQKQRTAIARALYLEPDILLMDEPFSSLDPMHRQEARAFFLGVWERRRCSTVVVTHDLLEAIYLGHHIIVMEEDMTLKVYDNAYFYKPLEENLQAIYDYKRYLEEKL